MAEHTPQGPVADVYDAMGSRPTTTNAREGDGVADLIAAVNRVLDFADADYVPNVVFAQLLQSRDAYTAMQAQQGAEPVACRHLGNVKGQYDHSLCGDCGSIRADSQWGIASNKWFKDRTEANFYRKHGYYPESDGAPR